MAFESDRTGGKLQPQADSNPGITGHQRREDLPTFEESFSPLAYHLFPDGCPSSSSKYSSTDTGASFETVWPQRKSRAVVSVKEALSSLRQVYRLGKRHGFTSQQQEAIVMVACATLMTKSNYQPPEEIYVVKNSPLRDGNSQNFRTLMRSTIPKPNQPNSSYIVQKIISCCQTRKIDDQGISCVLQFLTLAVRNRALSGDARHTLSCFYGIIYNWTMDANLCGDAVRLLHAITRRNHVRVYRAQRLHRFYHERTPEQQFNFAPIWLLLQLFARYDPHGCGQFHISGTERDLKSYSRWFALPDMVWERNFNNIWHGSLVVRQQIQETQPSTSLKVEGSKSSDNDERPVQKKQKTSSVVFATMDHLGDSFEGIYSFSTSFGPNKNRSLNASDLFEDASMIHMISLVEEENNSKNSTSVAAHETSRLKVCLPFMLQEEWFKAASSLNKKSSVSASNMDDETTDSGSAGDSHNDHDNDRGSVHNGTASDETGTENRGMDGLDIDETQQDPPLESISSRSASRLRLLKALASMASKTDSVPLEAESLILDDILRSWDGTDEWGAALCYELLPCISGCTTFKEIRAKILVPLEKLFLYGPPRLQHAIVSGTLASLLARLSMRDSTLYKGGSAEEMKASRKMMKELIHWVDNLLLQAFLGERGMSPELLSAASIDFFRVVCLDVARHCFFVVLPSTSLVYRLLLSSSPVAIDRTCQLLVGYKESLCVLKQKQDSWEGGTGNESSLVEGLDQ